LGAGQEPVGGVDVELGSVASSPMGTVTSLGVGGARVVQILRGSVLHREHRHAVRGPVAAQLVGDHHARHVPQSRRRRRKNFLADFALRQDWTRMSNTILSWSTTSGQQRPRDQVVPELLAPLPDGLVGDHDATLHHPLFHRAEAEATVVRHARYARDVRAGLHALFPGCALVPEHPAGLRPWCPDCRTSNTNARTLVAESEPPRARR
jgi:hypothetical protein